MQSVPIVTPQCVVPKHYGFTLENGVKCIIVQDESAVLSSAAMCIHSGQLRDPIDVPGLAHFCEHMLFMGTEKYPSENEYDEYISSHGGYDNAWTSDHYTTFYFKINHTALEGALDRFVNFFVAPSFSPGAVAREVKAVHSEDEKNHSIDYWRLHELLRTTYNPKHPHSRYGCGNYTTLWTEPQDKGIDIRDSLQKYFSENYFATNACIAIHSPYSPEKILPVITPTLAQMRTGEPAPFSFLGPDENLFSDEALASWVNVRAVKKMRALRVTWQVRCPTTEWRAIPGSYVSHIIGHECDCSVLGILKQRKWATAMVFGTFDVDDDFYTAYASFQLTKEGFGRIPEIVTLLYEGIGQCINNGVNERVYNDVKQEHRLSFEASEIGSGEDHCSTLATTAHACGLEHCWDGGSVLLEDNFELIEHFTRQLTPANAIITLEWDGFTPSCADPSAENTVADEMMASNEAEGSDGEDDDQDAGEEEEEDDMSDSAVLLASLPTFAQAQPDRLTRFHKVQYSTQKVPAELLHRWSSALSPSAAITPGLDLPSKNPFVASEFTVFPGQPLTDPPSEIRSSHGVTFVKRGCGPNRTFTAAVNVSFLSPVAYSSPLHRLYTHVSVALFLEAVTELSYFGDCASLQNTTVGLAGGPSITVCGPQDKLVDFLLQLVSRMLDKSLYTRDESKYTVFLDHEVQRMHAFAHRQPYQNAVSQSSVLTSCVNYDFVDILAAAPSASFEGFTSFIGSYFAAGLLFECFASGNILSTEEFETKLVRPLETLLTNASIPPAPATAFPRFRDVYAVATYPLEGVLSKTAAADASKHTVSPLLFASFPPFNPEDPNVTVLYDVFFGEATAALHAQVDCAAKLLSSAFFNALRTLEALGYIVFCQSAMHQSELSLRFCVQSAVVGVDGVYLLSRIVAFLDAVEAGIETLVSDDAVRVVVDGLVSILQKAPDSVATQTAGLVGAYTHPLSFQHKQERVTALRNLKPSDLRDFFRSHICNHRKEGRGMCVIVNNKATAEKDPFLFPLGSASGANEVASLALPPQRNDIAGTDGEVPAASNHNTLQLSDFTTNAPTVPIVAIRNKCEFQAAMSILKSKTF